MDRPIDDGMPDVPAVLDRLKGFQRATVDYAFERLYTAQDSTRRFLVADEVGLGKTLVARGVIAKAIEHMWEDIDRIDIVYICSNGQIAAQNINRLQMGGSKFIHADRLTLLPTVIRDLNANKVNYLAFTPGTSFNLTQGTGLWKERVLLYHLVQGTWPDPSTGPKNLFQGGVVDPNWWRSALDQFDAQRDIDRSLAKQFRNRLKDAGKVPGWGGEDLRRQYLDLCRRFHRFRPDVPIEDRRDQGRFIGRLRSMLAGVCVRALEPDLVILDEFQRFKDILDGDDEAAMLAEELFTYSDHQADVRLLLLSATPYKMYTLHHERDEDDHHADFLRTVEFLDPALKETGSFRSLLEDYRQALYMVDRDVEPVRRAMAEIEAELKRVMSRTERIREGGEDGDMLTEVPSEDLRLESSDVSDYLRLQHIGREVGQPQVIEYWKSAPYLLNFMDGYKLKKEVEARLKNGADDSLSRLLVAATAGGLLSWTHIEAYSTVDPANARLRHLMEWVARERLWEMLWLPPSLPYYRSDGPWERAGETGLTKRLLFSSWAVVPKTVAILLSYEVERRIYKRFDPNLVNTAEERKKRRGLLRFSEARGRLAGMPVLGILYPSFSLARIGDPTAHSSNGKIPTRGQVLRSVGRELRTRLRALSREVGNQATDREDETWYWAAPLLLDLAESPEVARSWFAQNDLAGLWQGVEDDDGEDSRWDDHAQLAKQVVEETPRLGRQPGDLVEVLSLAAIAGPAVCALRALTRPAGHEALRDLTARNAAGEVAWGFRSLFNQPEAMALVRGGGDDDLPYWQQVLNYCAVGNLQAVLDEYVHTVRDLEGLFDAADGDAWRELADVLGEALSIRIGTPTFDELRASKRKVEIEKRRMRTHFAMRFGDQVSEDGKAAREGQVRRAFNSPFWPFVLVSTSVGQEGLDFHNYCHAVVHWNLPSNPVDLEQREGRVHRYKGHAVRKNVAQSFAAEALSETNSDVWAELFEVARRHAPDDHGLVPYWLYSTEGGARIERHVPALPLSRDGQRFAALKRSLAVYRMVFGQAQQDDLMAFLLGTLDEDEVAKLAPELRVDLSPPVRE